MMHSQRMDRWRRLSGRRELMRRSMVPVAVLMAWAVVACAAPLGADPSRSPLSTTSALPTNPDGPSDELGQVAQAYGQRHPDEFAGVYYDQQHGGRLVARFTGHLDVHQHALDDLLGSPGRVVVLSAVFTEATLQRIVDAVGGSYPQLAAQGIDLMTAGVDVIHNRVEVEAKTDNPEAERILQAYGPPGVIVVHLYPADKPWSQPTEGPGWRLLGAFDTHLPYTVAIALDPAQLATEWERYGLPGDPPAWDPPREVVIILSDGIGSSCPELRLDGVVMDADARLVHGEFSDPYTPRVCTADLAGAKTFVVAVARDLLPPSPFTLRIRAEPIGCEPDCGMGPATVEVDLR
jgi:hypothetical protein